MSKKYRLSELFFSMQGEGYFAGTPSLWVRSFGCNLKCPGFPCDTEYSWNGEFKDQHETYTPEDIHQTLKALITNENNPTGSLVHPITNGDIHIVFTGGEPLLKKYQTMIREVVDLFLEENDWVHFTVETNGTQQLTDEFVKWAYESNAYPFFSISPKLESVSGEKGAVDFDNIIEISELFNAQIKFVANASEECEKELLDVTRVLVDNDIDSEFFVMPLGETMEDQLKIAPIVEKYQALGFRIALRGHTYVWSNAKNR
jgi:7-carboxy-7-deazaguanine synthase